MPTLITHRCPGCRGTEVFEVTAKDAELERLRAVLEQLRKAIANKGPSPTHHQAVMKRHRQEWPTLWQAIDNLIGEHHD